MNKTNDRISPVVTPLPLDYRRKNIALSIIGRVALCYLFVTAAVFHLTFGRDITLRDMATRGIPFPAAMNVLAMVLSGGLSLALLFNVRPRWAALGLALYTLCVSVVMYGPFQAEWQTTRVLFMKDMAIFGALLSWSCSLALNGGQKDFIAA